MKKLYMLNKNEINQLKKEYRNTYLGNKYYQKFKIMALFDIIMCLITGLFYTFNSYIIGSIIIILYFTEMLYIAYKDEILYKGFIISKYND